MSMTANRPGPPGGGHGRPGGPMGGGPGSLGMTLSAEKARDFKGTFRRLLGQLRPDRFVIVLVFALATFSVFFAVLGPKLLGHATNIIFAGFVGEQLPKGTTQAQAVDQLRAAGETNQADMLAAMTVTNGVDFTALAQVIALATVVYFLASVFSWLQYYLMAGVTQRTMFRLREDVDVKLGRLPLKYFDNHSRGDLLSRVTNDIDNISTTLQQTMTQAITSVFTVIGVLAMMILISPLLAMISVLTVVLSFVVTLLVAKQSQKQFTRQWKWTGALNGHVEEMYSGHEIVKIYGHQGQARDTFDESNEEMYESSFRAQFISGIIQPAMQFIANLNYVAIAVMGGVWVATGQMSLGDVQAFIQYSRQFTMPITQLASITNLLQSGLASAERVFELLDEPEETPDPTDPILLGRAVGAIELEDVDFRYELDKPLIEGLSLQVAPGQAIAIVGPTGAGKTTLVNLLMRFYDIDAGAIRLDGVDVRALTRDDLRRAFGMVLQDTWLFKGTIRENIAYGAGSKQLVAGLAEDEVLTAARAAHVDHFVRTLPDGYDTVLDDSASNVSAGEKQLLTIARAFLADPAVLILDEATSSVDTRTEVLIQQAMADLRRGRTSFVIAHRLSTIRDADLILVMEKGHIVEQGSHDELLAAHGAYYDLYMSQFMDSYDQVSDIDEDTAPF
jgi:ATP-binding cassette subfamily B multidrug efflux pump